MVLVNSDWLIFFIFKFSINLIRLRFCQRWRRCGGIHNTGLYNWCGGMLSDVDTGTTSVVDFLLFFVVVYSPPPVSSFFCYCCRILLILLLLFVCCCFCCYSFPYYCCCWYLHFLLLWLSQLFVVIVFCF